MAGKIESTGPPGTLHGGVELKAPKVEEPGKPDGDMTGGGYSPGDSLRGEAEPEGAIIFTDSDGEVTLPKGKTAVSPSGKVSAQVVAEAYAAIGEKREETK